mgnify:CR=1 FL=1
MLFRSLQLKTQQIESLNLLVPAAATAGGGPGEVGLVERQGSSILKPGEVFGPQRVRNVGASHQNEITARSVGSGVASSKPSAARGDNLVCAVTLWAKVQQNHP